MDLGRRNGRISRRTWWMCSISAKEGFAVAMENNVFTILDTTAHAGADGRGSGKRADLKGTADAKAEEF